MAPSSIHNTPMGLPCKAFNSSLINKPMPAKAATTAAALRQLKANPMNTAPNTTVQTGMVNPSVEARPEGKACTPKMAKVCHSSILGTPNTAMSRHSRPWGHMRTPWRR